MVAVAQPLEAFLFKYVKTLFHRRTKIVFFIFAIAMKKRKLINIIEGEIVNPLFSMAAPVNLCIEEGEQVAILGANASGKTRLAEIITGRHRLKGDAISYDFYPSEKHYVSDNIKFVAFKDSYGAADTGYYHQLRWNQVEMDPELIPTVGSVIDSYLKKASDDAEAETRLHQLVDMFGLDALRDKFVVTLSSGELRKLQLTKLLITTPRVLMIDNPFIGLDAETRLQLSELFEQLTSDGRLTIIILVSRKEEIPSFITHVIPVADLMVGEKYEWKGCPGPADVLKFNNVSICYGERTILKGLNWRVREGEHWALTGENGCGKSTLLSLVCADNPQGYSCDIELFGRKRGTGESIWDIKKNIGYVSPEMHRSYNEDLPAMDIVSSGFFDTVGLFRRPSPEQLEIARRWMKVFGIDGIAERSFLRISSGEQRLCLLARAFVKDPALLILDEPMHGLDDTTREKVRGILDDYFTRFPSKTLLMVTHYMEELPDCIDHHLVLARH